MKAAIEGLDQGPQQPTHPIIETIDIIKAMIEDPGQGPQCPIETIDAVKENPDQDIEKWIVRELKKTSRLSTPTAPPTPTAPLTPSDQYYYGNADNYISDEGVDTIGTTGLSQPLNNCGIIDLENEMNNIHPSSTNKTNANATTNDAGKQRQKDNENNQQKPSVSPELSGGYLRRLREKLEDMDEDQYKLFHVDDEVLQILYGLDDNLCLDCAKKWSKISCHVSKHTMPAIGKALEGNFRFKFSELNVNDKNLEDLAPTMHLDDFKNNLEKIIKRKDYHSDEISETDYERTQSEHHLKVRPKNKKKTDNH
ncbi:6266_t:CDS:2, partial [Ambispora leptoticha]